VSRLAFDLLPKSTHWELLNHCSYLLPSSGLASSASLTTSPRITRSRGGGGGGGGVMGCQWHQTEASALVHSNVDGRVSD
jgi:hypothetical protein